jgi:hypothetical protein
MHSALAAGASTVVGALASGAAVGLGGTLPACATAIFAHSKRHAPEAR